MVHCRANQFITKELSLQLCTLSTLYACYIFNIQSAHLTIHVPVVYKKIPSCMP